MLSIAELLYRLLVVQFYKENGGFFMFIFLVMFAIVDPGQVVSYHAGLMQLILSSVIGMALGMAAWLFYAYKCLAFVHRNLEKEENSFLINLQAFSVKRQLLLLFGCQFILYLPVLIYAGFTIGIGLRTGQFNSVAILLVYLVAINIAVIYLYYRKLNSYHTASINFTIKLPFRIGFVKPAVVYPVFYILYKRKLAWLALKVFSFFIFYLVFILHEGNFSLAYFRLLFLIVTITHSMVVYFSFEFTEKQLAFTRNLPIARTNRFLSYLLTSVLILFPEFCWMISYTGSILSLPDMLLTFSAGIGQLLLLASVLYLPGMQQQRFTWVACFVYFASAILLPSGISIIILSELLLALLIFYRSYYRFELNTSGS